MLYVFSVKLATTGIFFLLMVWSVVFSELFFIFLSQTKCLVSVRGDKKCAGHTSYYIIHDDDAETSSTEAIKCLQPIFCQCFSIWEYEFPLLMRGETVTKWVDFQWSPEPAPFLSNLWWVERCFVHAAAIDMWSFSIRRRSTDWTVGNSQIKIHLWVSKRMQFKVMREKSFVQLFWMFI